MQNKSVLLFFEPHFSSCSFFDEKMNHPEVIRLNKKRTHAALSNRNKGQVNEYDTSHHPFQQHLHLILQQVGISLTKMDQLPLQLPWNHEGYVRWDLMEPLISVRETDDVFPNSTVCIYWVVTKLRLDCWGIAAYLKYHNYFQLLTCAKYPRANRMIQQLFFQKLQALFFPRYVHWPNTYAGDARVVRHITGVLNHCFTAHRVLVPLHSTCAVQHDGRQVYLTSVTLQIEPYHTVYGRRHSLHITLHSNHTDFMHSQRCWSDPHHMDECYYSTSTSTEYVVLSEIVTAVSRFIDRDTFCVFLMGLKSRASSLFRQFVLNSLGERKVLKHVLQFCGY